MLKRHLLPALCLWLPVVLSAQQGVLNGTVRDSQSREPLQNVSVSAGLLGGISTDAQGNYELSLPVGDVTVVFSCVGYAPDTQEVEIREGRSRELNVKLKSTDTELNTVVVSTSKFGKRIQKESVSMDVYKPRLLETNNITNSLQLVSKVPGVTVLDGSISIRGGSGYAYGSGSRVLLVVDDLPMLTPDRSEIRWDMVPLENASQVEVIKGSSTVQYGASALNGVVHVRTDLPRDSPETRIQLYHEIIGAPPVKTYNWWKGKNLSYLQRPQSMGVTFLHKHKLGPVDLVASGNLHEEQSHLRDEYADRCRFSVKLRYTPAKLNRLSVWLNTNFMVRTTSFQFWGKSKEENYIGASGVILKERFRFVFLDPGLSYIDRGGNQHRVLFRWFNQFSLENKESGPHTNFFTTDYQFRHDFGKWAKLFLGVNNLYYTVKDGTLGKHHGNYGGGYLMGDFTYKGLTLNLGTRLEYLQLDSNFTLLLKEDRYKNGTRIRRPVLRFGLNYQFLKFNYLRASVGEAYRFPSIAERFVKYNLGNIHILPNDSIMPEYGLTAELGYKRSFKVSNWRGYFDAVVFFNEFRDMVEFQMVKLELGTPENPGLVPYFQSVNVTQARIFGWEFALVGEGTMGPVDLTMQAGWTYFYPLSLGDTSVPNNLGYTLQQTFTTFHNPDSLSQLQMLKYRNRHTFKADIDALFFQRLRIGTSLIYYSYMDNVDEIFKYYIPGAADYRKENYNQGDFIWDIRVGFEFTKNVGVNFIAKNVLNRDYQLRIGKPNQPRTYNMALNIRF